MAADRALLIVDTPNIFRSIRQAYGPEARPDYRTLRDAVTMASGAAVQAEAHVNGGVSPAFVGHLARLGYSVVYSHAEDCDEMVISRAVALHERADYLVLAGGDGKYESLVKIFRALGRKVIVISVPGSTSARLHATAHAVLDFPWVAVPPPPIVEEHSRAA